MSRAAEPWARPPRCGPGWRWPLLLLLGGVGLQLVAALLPGPVERFYYQGLYPLILRTLRLGSAWCPVSLAELLLALLLLHLGWRAGRDLAAWRRRTMGLPAVLGAGLRRLFAWGVALYLWYLLGWGLLHQRPDWEVREDVPVTRPTDAELEALARSLMAEAEALREGLPEDETGAVRATDRGVLLDRAPRGYRDLPGLDPRLVATLDAPRAAWTSPVLALLGVTGVYVPFTGEPHVNRLLPHAELPFVAAHELAHQLGVAREDEASLLAVQACRRHPDRWYRYSGAFTALRHVLAECWRRDPAWYERLAQQMSAGLQADQDGLRRFWSRWYTPVADLGEAARDVYLRSQGTEEGAQAYDRLVDLLVAERRSRGR